MAPLIVYEVQVFATLMEPPAPFLGALRRKLWHFTKLSKIIIICYNFLFLISYLVKIVSGHPVLPLTCWKPPRELYSVHAV